MPLTIANNIASLQAQRQFGRATESRTKINEQLSSGLRINRASDDAAGLAIAESLRVDTRIFQQGLRNGNDAVNAIRIFDGALEQLTTISTRIQELAEQSANGTLGNTQRQALDAEAQALRDEATRIVESTEFNGINLLDGSTTSLSVQVGGSQIDTTFPFIETDTQIFTPDGTFQAQVTFSVGRQPFGVQGADINGDGNNDIIVGNRQDGEFTFFLGNGDGTFQASTSINTQNDQAYVIATDVDLDGNIDLVEGTRSTTSIGVFLGNGDGTFGARTGFNAGNVPQEGLVADVNGDSIPDIINTNVNDFTVGVYLGNGDGTFQAEDTFNSTSFVTGVESGDFDGDGNVDLAVGVFGSNRIAVFLGNGDGTFEAEVTFSTSSGATNLVTEDFDGDGITDIITANYGDDTVSVFIGNGDGTFEADVTYGVGSEASDIITTDIDGDGNLDIITADRADDTLSVLLGNGDGTFEARTTLTGGDQVRSLALADFNGDGVADLLSANEGDDSISFFLADATATGENRTTNLLLIPEFSLATQGGALSALDTLEGVINEVTTARGSFGSFESRLVTAINNLQVAAENYSAAESQIRDTDIAQAAADSTRIAIQQQLAASILAQANQQPSISLSLLS